MTLDAPRQEPLERTSNQKASEKMISDTLDSGYATEINSTDFSEFPKLFIEELEEQKSSDLFGKDGELLTQCEGELATTMAVGEEGCDAIDPSKQKAEKIEPEKREESHPNPIDRDEDKIDLGLSQLQGEAGDDSLLTRAMWEAEDAPRPLKSEK